MARFCETGIDRLAGFVIPIRLELCCQKHDLVLMLGFPAHLRFCSHSLFAVAAFALPSQAIPQWIELGNSDNEIDYSLDFNSLKRDGQRVGFVMSRNAKPDSAGSALFMWVDCKRWAWTLEGGSEWALIPNQTVAEAAALFACSKSKPTPGATKAQTGGDDLTRIGMNGICSFLSTKGSDVIDKPCLVKATSSGTTLRWSDGVVTEMSFEGDRVIVEDPGSSNLQGVILSRNPKRMAIQYPNGIIRWCWSSGCPKAR